MDKFFTVAGFMLGVVGLLLSIYFGLLSLGSLFTVGALLRREAYKAAVEFNSLLNWYVAATDGTRSYDPKEPNCLTHIYDCHWAIVTDSSKYMSEEMKADILKATQKMI